MTNYHTHSSYCDGSASPREMVEFALSHGFTTLGFTGHSPLPFENTFSITDYAGYCGEIRSLKSEYAGRLKELGLICEINTRGIYKGRHTDYYPGNRAILRCCRKRPYVAQRHRLVRLHLLGPHPLQVTCIAGHVHVFFGLCRNTGFYDFTGAGKMFLNALRGRFARFFSSFNSIFESSPLCVSKVWIKLPLQSP